MTPDPLVLKGTLADLKDIVSRSQGIDHECVHLLGEIEAIVSEIERKTVATVAKAAVATTSASAAIA